MHWINDIWQWTFSLVPWWLFYIAGAAACMAILAYMPNKLGAILAAAAAAWLCAVGSYSMGCKTCSAAVEARWERRLADETARIASELGAQLLAERMRANDAEQRTAEITKEANDAVAMVKPGGPVVIPELVARSLCRIGKSTADLASCEASTNPSVGPQALPGVLPKPRPLAKPGWWLDPRGRR